MPKNGRTYGQDILKGEYANIDGRGSLGRRFRHAEPAEEKSSGAGTSVFDPVLCELAYVWFCPPGGLVLDPFAGGSVRGIVAARTGRRYFGIDLSAPQIEANRAQARAICAPGDPAPEWAEGDARDMDNIYFANSLTRPPADFIFTCPPYFDLERYSDDPRDLSVMPFGKFLESFRDIIWKAAQRLAQNRFACIVVGDVRDGDGLYRNLPAETIMAFGAAGLALYNEAILVTAAGSLPIRAGKQFEASRKLGKTHQQVYCFVKGDPVAATRAVGPCQFGTSLEPGAESEAADFANPLGPPL